MSSRSFTIEERAAEEFDEEVTKHHMEQNEPVTEELPCGCPSTTVTQFESQAIAGVAPWDVPSQQPMLRQWPVQLTLVPPTAPFLQGADLVLAADCVPFAYADFHQEFLRDHSLLVACPKLDDFPAHLKKLTDIFSQSSVKSVTVVTMEVPCCSGLVSMVKQAVQQSEKDIPVTEKQVSTRGELNY